MPNRGASRASPQPKLCAACAERMSHSADPLAPLGLSALADDGPLLRDPQGLVRAARGAPLAGLGASALLAIRHVIETERPGAWSLLMKAAGRECAQVFARDLDARLAAAAQPALAALPVEASLAFLQGYFAKHGWGRLDFDLSLAGEHALVVARLAHAAGAEGLQGQETLADPMAAGLLLGFLEHISGQALDCLEVACAAGGAPHCEFFIADPPRLAVLAPLAGRESADALRARFVAG